MKIAKCVPGRQHHDNPNAEGHQVLLALELAINAEKDIELEFGAPPPSFGHCVCWPTLSPERRASWPAMSFFSRRRRHL